MPFYFNDFLSFGHIIDISRLYGIQNSQEPDDMTYTRHHGYRWDKLQKHLGSASRSLDYNKVTEQNYRLYKYNRMIRRFCNPEIYITRTFYKKHIAPIDKTKILETNWKFIRDYLILIDNNTLLFDWFKYEQYVNVRYGVDIQGQLAFSRWLDMYRNFKIDWV